MKPLFRLETVAGVMVAHHVEVADSILSRFRGLMFRDHLPEGHGLALRPCNSIHMFFMRFALDVLFLDRQRRVKKVMLNLKPWRISPIVFGARTVVELPAGTLGDRRLVGSKLTLE